VTILVFAFCDDPFRDPFFASLAARFLAGAAAVARWVQAVLGMPERNFREAAGHDGFLLLLAGAMLGTLGDSGTCDFAGEPAFLEALIAVANELAARLGPVSDMCSAVLDLCQGCFTDAFVAAP